MKSKFIKKRHNLGFSLPEVIIASGLAVGLALVTGRFLVTHLQSNAASESLTRQRDDWNTATRFIQSEIAMSSRIITDAASISIPSSCSLTSSEFKLALDLPRNVPLVIYGVKKLSSSTAGIDQSQWLGEGQNDQNFGLLIRCGPNLILTKSGIEDYDNTSGSVEFVLLDGIDTGSPGEGFYVTTNASTGQNNSKSVSYTLSLKGTSKTRFASNISYYNYSQGSGGFSRVNPIASFPDENSACQRLCGYDDEGVLGCSDYGSYFVVPVTEENFTIPYQGITENDNITACSLINNANITGGDKSDVIDGMMPNSESYPGITIDGGEGRNIIFGTPGDDTLTAGSGDDVFVGRAGSDTIDGGDGNNSYSPWPSLSDPTVSNLETTQTTTITGGNDLDVLYLRGKKSEFSGASSCTSSGGCTITPADPNINISLTLNSGFDVIVFKDGRIDLP